MMVTPHASPDRAPLGHTPELRRQPRHDVALDVSFGPATASGGGGPPESQLQRTVTVNVSLGGLCLCSDLLYPIGASLFCSLTLPGRAAPLELTGTLVWFQRAQRRDRAYKLGIEFASLTADDRAALQSLFDQPPSARRAPSRRLLLVDDDAELRRALQVRFESSGYQVITAADGLEALRKGREEHPELIILDVMLPSMSGLEVCRMLKFDPKFHHIPILMFTARCRPEDEQMSRDVGADAYVTKPFSGVDLIAKIEQLLHASPR